MPLLNSCLFILFFVTGALFTVPESYNLNILVVLKICSYIRGNGVTRLPYLWLSQQRTQYRSTAPVGEEQPLPVERLHRFLICWTFLKEKKIFVKNRNSPPLPPTFQNLFYVFYCIVVIRYKKDENFVTSPCDEFVNIQISSGPWCFIYKALYLLGCWWEELT